MVRIRYSLQEVLNKYDTKVDTSILENLIIAFRRIQRLPSDHPDSFFTIGGYHGEPFVKEDPDNPDWWGGYCQHYTVLFPTWHRAYVFRIEEALRNVLPDADISLPFWDECLTYGSSDNPIPWILTAPKFKINEGDEDDNNPLYSYKLAQAIADNHDVTDKFRYSKPAGYETVRYPLSGLVGNDQDRKATQLHNDNYADPVVNASILNTNVKEWLEGTVVIPPDSTGAKIPDTYSAYARYKISLDAPNYTVFSNRSSKNQWIVDKKEGQWDVVALEEGHNAIHLALGGMYQPKTKDDAGYNANPIPGANGDMGENETAGFDPIFYLHHAFIDYLFWTWQKRHDSTKRGSLDVIWTEPEPYPGTFSSGDPVFKAGERLYMTSDLQPFRKPDGKFYTSEDVTDIETDLDYTYGPGSFDMLAGPIQGAEDAPTPPITIVHISGISRADHRGSFVIRTRASLPDGTLVEIGRDAVLSRWYIEGCKNCMNSLEENSFVSIDEALMKRLGLEKKDDLKDKLDVWVQSRKRVGPSESDGVLGAKRPNIELL